jgi:hypothetical protein
MFKLEDMIDTTSVVELIEAIAEICQDKEEHINVNWQDDKLARHWRDAARKLNEVSTKITV